MRYQFLIIPTVLIFQVVGAQNDTASVRQSQGNVIIPVSATTSTAVIPPESTPPPASPTSERTSIMDYKSVYETATVEEEVQMAAERFKLTQSQQDVWLTAAADRREIEKQTREKLGSNTADYDKQAVYRGLRTAQNTFYETISGYLTPTQKQDFETDRLILNEKQKKLAKLPPPPPPLPPVDSVIVAPVDSAAIKESEKSIDKGTKSKKKKKSGGE